MHDCYSNSFAYHDPPLLYNVAKDPSETQPLDTSLPGNAKILQDINNFISKHSAELQNQNIVNQFAYLRLLPVPWLQPCCNFPSCYCSDPVYP